MKKEIVTTADGSHSLFVPELNEHYHSVHGAYNESLHVFINQGFRYTNTAEISVLEVGFGTGLNALLTCIEADKKNVKTIYYAVEKFPITWEFAKHLNYNDFIPSSYISVLQKIHTSKWKERIQVTPNFGIEKIEAGIMEISEDIQPNLVYFDAFAPEKQPDMWESPVFKKLYGCMQNNGILTTYCAKGNVRRTMQSVGFSVERLPGPPGKREMLRATKQAS